MPSLYLDVYSTKCSNDTNLYGLAIFSQNLQQSTAWDEGDPAPVMLQKSSSQPKSCLIRFLASLL